MRRLPIILLAMAVVAAALLLSVGSSASPSAAQVPPPKTPTITPKINVCVVAFKLNGTPWTKTQINTLVNEADGIWAPAGINITWNNTIINKDDPQPPPAGAGAKGDIRDFANLPFNPNVATAQQVAPGLAKFNVTFTAKGGLAAYPLQVGHDVVVGAEHMKVTAVDVPGNQISVTRAQKSTADVKHLSGTPILAQGDPKEDSALDAIPAPSGKTNCVRVFFIGELVDNLGNQVLGATHTNAYAGKGLGAKMVFTTKAKTNSYVLAHELGHIFGLQHNTPSKPGNLMNAGKGTGPTGLNADQINTARAGATVVGQPKVGGIAEVVVGGGAAPAGTADASGSSSPPYSVIAGVAAAAVAIAASGWYARRRFRRRRI